MGVGGRGQEGCIGRGAWGQEQGGDRGRGSRGVILVVWRCPDGCAQAAGIHVMGVGEVAHHEESPLSGAEVSLQVHPSRRHLSYGRMGDSITWGSPVWAWQGPGGPGEGGRSSSGQGNVDSWEVRCKVDPSRAGPESSNVREQREGEGKCAVSRFNRAVAMEKSSTGPGA